MIEKYTIGADPEGFLFNTEENQFVPSFGLIGGDKYQPRKIDRGYAVLEDNVMVEYNIPPSDMGENLRENIEHANRLILEGVLPEGYEIRYQPSVVFNPDTLAHEKAFEFGCMPDYDVYTKETRDSVPMIQQMIDTHIRFAGGHVHFGYENPDLDTSADMVPFFDLFLGVPSVLLDKDQSRREAYGQPGMFRFKDYGFEYRTLSNFWVQKHEDLIVSQIGQAVDAFNNGIGIENDIPDIINTIKNGDSETAKTLIKKYTINV